MKHWCFLVIYCVLLFLAASNIRRAIRGCRRPFSRLLLLRSLVLIVFGMAVNAAHDATLGIQDESLDGAAFIVSPDFNVHS